jgi:hypothetical protein
VLLLVSCIMADEPCWWILCISPLWHPEVRHEVTLVWKVLLEQLPAKQLHQADWERYITIQPLISIHKYHFWTKVVTDLQPSNGSQLNNDYVCFDGIYIVNSSHIKLSINKAKYLFLMQVCFGFIIRLHKNTYRYLRNNFKISSKGDGDLNFTLVSFTKLVLEHA